MSKAIHSVKPRHFARYSTTQPAPDLSRLREAAKKLTLKPCRVGVSSSKPVGCNITSLCLCIGHMASVYVCVCVCAGAQGEQAHTPGV